MNRILLLFFYLTSIFGFSQTSCWKEVSSLNSHTLAIKSDGTLWAWGNNNYGQLGDNTINTSTNPIQISSLTTWKQVSAGSQQSFAIKTDGTLWVWGRNDGGRLGISTSIDSKTPIQLGSLTTWKSVYAGTYYCFATRTNDTLWGWGENSFGQLGLGTNSSVVTSPTQIGTSSWKDISASYYFTVGIKTNGTLWSWGYNAYGQIGDGTTIDRNVPTSIGGSSTDWKQVDTGYYHGIAVKNNGTLWAWGNNGSGQYGNGTIGISTNNINQIGTNPLQIGTETNWKLTNAGGEYSTAIKNDNTLWSWGKNTLGQLGLGNTNDTSTPIQIGTDINWDKISASALNAYAINSNFDLFSWGQNYSSSPSTISCTTLGISDNLIETIKIYPNPVKEIIYLSKIRNLDYKIYDLLGKIVLEGIINENQINVNSLKNGIYILKLESEKNTFNQKFIKE
jgi:alpha-tubulin suppressor-like RCC1 family protein